MGVELQRSGKCRSIGVSNYSVDHLEEIRVAGLPLPAANQIELHPFCCQAQLCEYMAAHKILPIAYSSLAPLSNWRQGQRSGKAIRGRGVLDVDLPFARMASQYGTSE